MNLLEWAAWCRAWLAERPIAVAVAGSMALTLGAAGWTWFTLAAWIGQLALGWFADALTIPRSQLPHASYQFEGALDPPAFGDTVLGLDDDDR